MTTVVQVNDVWDQYSHIFYEIFHDGIRYILSKRDFEIYLAIHDLTAEIEIDHRYPCWYDKSLISKGVDV